MLRSFCFLKHQMNADRVKPKSERIQPHIAISFVKNARKTVCEAKKYYWRNSLVSNVTHFRKALINQQRH